MAGGSPYPRASCRPFGFLALRLFCHTAVRAEPAGSQPFPVVPVTSRQVYDPGRALHLTLTVFGLLPAPLGIGSALCVSEFSGLFLTGSSSLLLTLTLIQLPVQGQSLDTRWWLAFTGQVCLLLNPQS